MSHQPVSTLDEVRRMLAEAGIAEATDEAQSIVDAAVRLAGPESASARSVDMATQRASGIPLAYVTGRASFMGLELLITPGALVPRPETELLAQTALGVLREGEPGHDLRVIDMCCGSGNLTCAIASNHPAVRVWASDLTDAAIAVTRINVEHLGLGDRVAVVKGDLFEPLAEFGLEGRIDMVVCNPPYISTGKLEKESSSLLSHEPREAFDGGPYGLSIFQRVVKAAAAFLRPGGTLLFEIGAGQERQVSLLFERARSYDPVRLFCDPTGAPRVALARRL